MLTEAQAADMACLFTKNITSIKNLNGFHNEVYEVCGNITFILRVSEGKRDEETKAEIDFLFYLQKNFVPVAPPIESLQNKYVHQAFIDDICYTVSAYQKAKGKDCWSRGIDGKERFKVIGQTLGKMHRLSMQYYCNNKVKRRQWDENPHILKAHGILFNYNKDLADKFNSYIALMNHFPKKNSSFGLIHGDFLFSNYFFDDKNNISVFDFDECEYSWYIYDIAVCMYYYLLGGDPTELCEKANEAEDMFLHIMSGYVSECELDLDCIRNIDLFFQLRDYVLLSSILKKSAIILSGWKKSFVEGATDRLLNGKPFIQADFEKVYKAVGNK